MSRISTTSPAWNCTSPERISLSCRPYTKRPGFLIPAATQPTDFQTILLSDEPFPSLVPSPALACPPAAKPADPLPARRVRHGAELRFDEFGFSSRTAHRGGSDGDQRGAGDAGGVRDSGSRFVVADVGDLTVSEGVQYYGVCGGRVREQVKSINRLMYHVSCSHVEISVSGVLSINR